MNSFLTASFAPALPEMFFAIVALLLILTGVLRRDEAMGFKVVSILSLLTLACTGVILWRFCQEPMQAFRGMFASNAFTAAMKGLVLAGSAASLLLMHGYALRERIARFEYPLLVLFSTLGMMLMISANDLMSLYMGLELQSLPLYVLAALQRDNLRSTEAGIKYFVLGALSSGMLLYGASLIYGATGATNFDAIARALSGPEAVTAGVVTGMVMMLCGLAFKVAAVPFHMWTPDVYEGAPTSVTAFFAIAPKIAALALLTRVLSGPFAPMMEEWRQVVVVLSVASMSLGAIAAIGQTNIKRLLAYSSIGHMGYALIGLAAGDAAGVRAVVVYAALYMAAAAGTFAVVLMMKHKDRMTENISDLSGLAGRRPMLALALAALMFSMTGIPPLAGFFGKLLVFKAAVDNGLFALAVIGVLTSVVAAYYYLRIVKVMYFDAAPDQELDAAEDLRLNTVLLAASLVVVLFVFAPGPLLESANAAALSVLAPEMP